MPPEFRLQQAPTDLETPFLLLGFNPMFDFLSWLARYGQT